MADQALTLMAVFAHPDDEVWTGGTLAKYSDSGVRTVLVTATRGEEGEIHDPDLDPGEALNRLGDIRETELRRAVEILGISQLHFLGFRDSGMVGTPANERPDNFHNADAGEAVGRLVRLIRQERPQVIITDNERGTYGHPDHIAAHLTTVAAFDAAGDPTQYVAIGPAPWQAQKLYYTAFARSDFLKLREMMRARGLSPSDEEEENIDDLESFTVSDDVITTRVDVRGYGQKVRDAMRAHRTQIPQDDPFLTMPVDIAEQVFGSATYTRVRSLVDAPLPESDLFAGIRDGMI